MILFLISYSNRLCISLLVFLAEYFLAEMFSCPALSHLDVACARALCLEESSPSPSPIPFEQRADYWFCGCSAGLWC